ncbi:MAG: TIGR04219 family outer membrane beta-barrel protein [Pseudomonadales bacterium]|nr:TIGR04219 family outer membrane beta-barrel protein [Pseudomonadales bacterium]
MRNRILALGALLAAAPLAQADIIGAGASVSYWDAEVAGKAGQKGDLLDVENDLDLGDNSNTTIALYLEHPVPLLPNVRIAHSSLDQSGDSELTTDFGGIGAGVPVTSDLEFEQTDLTLYYEVLDNWVNLDLGITARDFSGELVVTQVGGAISDTTKVDAVVPMGYVAARFDLPFTGASVGAEGNAISFDGDSMYDVNAYGQYEIALVQLRLGYREIAVDYEDGSDRFDIDVSGPFISAGLSF